MICDPCRQAGVLLNMVPSEAHPAPKQEAQQKHNICKLAQVAAGNTSRCDCQHRIALGMINQERIQKDDTVPTSGRESQ
jgi:hypothetical protein